jgi:hypothetical protein
MNTFLLAVEIRLRKFYQFFINLFCYYLFHPKFFLVDIWVLLSYFFESPYHMIRVYDKAHPGNTLGPYGETDFHTFHKILKAFNVSKDSVFYELGSGRGRLSFWMSEAYHQKEVVGVEKHPVMVQKALRVLKFFRLAHITFINDDWSKVDFKDCDILYLYVLDISDKDMKKLALHLSSLKEGAKIITVNWWFGEVFPEKFIFENKTSASFPWGDAEVYLQRIHH